MADEVCARSSCHAPSVGSSLEKQPGNHISTFSSLPQGWTPNELTLLLRTVFRYRLGFFFKFSY
jgi:hypothetical protein